MRKGILTILTAASVALAAVSCSEKETMTTTYENNYEQTLAQDDSVSVRVSHSIEYYQSYKGGKSLRKKINKSIVVACFGNEYDGLSVEQASDAVSDTLIANYQKDAGRTYDEYAAYAKESDPGFALVPATLCNWYYSVTGKIGDEFKELLTYQVFSESYVGGAHGMYYSIPYIIDLRSGRIVTENDLFNPGYVAPVTELIKESLKSAWESDGSYDDMAQEGMVPNGKCGVSAEGVTWYYQPYEIASYAQGIITATVDWDSLKPYLKTDYSRL